LFANIDSAMLIMSASAAQVVTGVVMASATASPHRLAVVRLRQ
jgi:hypothetical protein